MQRLQTRQADDSSLSSIDMHDKPWAEPYGAVLDRLSTNPERGLSAAEVEERRHRFGLNQLRKVKQKSWWKILIKQLQSLIVLLLGTAVLISYIFGEIPEAWAIFIVIVINTAIGFFTELKAVRSMEALLKLGKTKTRVRRSGNTIEVDAEELVPGDIVVVEGGDVITADLRLIESSKMQANESTLTGESMPVEKSPQPVAEDAVIADRKNMLYKGTAVTRGAGMGVVVATGAVTELGRISTLVQEAGEEHTPLEERLDQLGYRLIALTLAIVVVVILSGIYHGKELFLMIETGIALAVASIPEGLPIVATIALAKGMRVMARKNALLNRLSSVETLGTTGIIFTDKTGTLTENRMTVTHYLLANREFTVHYDGAPSLRQDGKGVNLESDAHLKRVLETAVLCNNAALDSADIHQGVGDPLEVALLTSVRTAAEDYEDPRSRYPEEREEAFDPEVKMMATWNRIEESHYRVSVKGAPGAVLASCTMEMSDGVPVAMDAARREEWLELNSRFAANGYRLIALAYKEAADTAGEPYQGLTFLGLVALHDPPRHDVKESIARCKSAGIRVIMVTGDQKETARSIASSVELIDEGNDMVVHGKDFPSLEELADGSEANIELEKADIFARISPKQKLDLISYYQNKGHIVAMTGDGVNDAPALKKADIGIAMGLRGTQVAKEAADMVLTDDAFSTIVSAIEQGRVIFGNIRRFVYYLLSCNVSEVMIVGLATLVGAPLPLLPLQILFLNLVTDVFPALALGVGEAEEGVMHIPPRNTNEPILTNTHWYGIGAYGLVITGSVLGALYIGIAIMELDQVGAVTISFLTLAFAQLWHVFNMRSPASNLLDNTIIRNKWVWGALFICVILTLTAVYVPVFAEALLVRPPSSYGWVVIIGMSLLPLVIGQVVKVVRHPRSVQDG